MRGGTSHRVESVAVNDFDARRWKELSAYYYALAVSSPISQSIYVLMLVAWLEIRLQYYYYYLLLLLYSTYFCQACVDHCALPEMDLMSGPTWTAGTAINPFMKV